MTIREREGLIARIRHIRRVAAAAEQPSAPDRAATDASQPDTGSMRALEERVAHLERLVEGLQDSVHRETSRQGKMIADLQAQTQPSAISAAISKDARERGL